jgi:hypothetical protein
MISKGITPEPIRDEWEMRARNWFLAHGGSYDELTGDLICSDGLRIPRENWKKIVKEMKEGKRKFTPDREKDLLTLVLGNDKHGGRMRGFGSVAESEAPTNNARWMIEGGPSYLVDGIKESISCELHQRMKNISMKVAVEQALPYPPDARWHGREIPAGYAKVKVDEIVSGFMIWSLTSLDPKMRGHSEKYWVDSFYGTRTTSRF